jgi:MoaA/NifB/PqqE/SkfB family radical SAM enzyme
MAFYEQPQFVGADAQLRRQVCIRWRQAHNVRWYRMYKDKPRLHSRQREHRAGDLRTLSLDVTSRCNMRCPHCYAATFAAAEPVELAILGRALDEAHELGVYHYVMQGGEPSEDAERLESILRLCHPSETYINVVSNGWNITPEVIAWLKTLQVDKIAFSLDSGLEVEHDAGRMPGSFQRTMQAVDAVLAAGLLTSISTVVTRESLYSEGFRAAYDYALDKGIRIDVQIAEPVGKWDGQRALLMRPQDTEYIKRLQVDGPILSNGQKMVNRDIYSGEEDHCPAGTEFMAISVDGQLLPCNFLQFSLGNIRDRTIKEMREDLLTSRWFDGVHPVCLCGEDADFIERYIMPYVQDIKPLNAHTIFGLGGDL